MEAIHKQRMDHLLQQAMQQSVILVEAAPGYGKSEQLKSFLDEKSMNYSWLRLRKMDNYLFFHWKQLMKALYEAMPKIKEGLCTLALPDGPAQIAELIEVIETNEQEAVLVIDDYSLLKEQSILFLYENLLEAGFEHLHLVIISSKKTELSQLCIKSNVSFKLIGEEELRLSTKEVQKLFMKNQVSLTWEQAKAITNRWHGWPLPIAILAEQDRMADGAFAGSLERIQQLCYAYLYRNYSKELKVFLIQLALLEQIPLEILDSLSEEKRELLENHPLIIFDYKNNLLLVQETYRDFLRGNRAELIHQEKNPLIQLVALIFFQQDKLEEALPLLLKSEQYDQAVEAIWKLMTPTTDYAKAQFIYDQVNRLPTNYSEEHPRAELQRISLLFFLGKTEKIEEDLNNLVHKINSSQHPDTEALGEAHYLLAQILSMEGQLDAMEHLRIASRYLPNGSQYWGEPAPIVLKASWLRLPRYLEGVPDQLGKAQQLYEDINPCMTILLKGRNIYLDLFFAAEKAYYTFEINEARVRFLELLHIGKNEQVPEIILLAREFLLRIGLIKGELQEAQDQLQAIEAMITEAELYQYNGLRVQAISWIALYLYKTKDIPARVIEANFREKSKWEIVRNGFIQARYIMIHSHGVDEALALLNYLEEVYSSYEGHWLSLMYVKIYRAIAYSKGRNRERAIDDLFAAYEMTYHNNIVTPFIGCAGDMRYLIQIAREDAPEKFDPAWLDLIFTKSKGLEQKVSLLRKKADAYIQTIKLTPRRKEILRDLAQGLTAEEIAEQRHIAVSTVRTHIKNIYSDLGAVNRADAIRIAVSQELI